MAKVLSCAICHEVFADACVLPCGHDFCQVCIEQAFDTEHSCPTCQTRHRRSEIRPNRSTRRLVEIFQNRPRLPLSRDPL